MHKFLWDRFRGIRQDLTQQHMSNTFSARLHEEMVRFHIMAEHILCEEVATIQDPDGFNSHLNVEQLNKCLTTLFDIYDAYAEKDRALPNEPEMRAYMLLLQLDTHGKFDHNHSQVCDDRHPRFPMDSIISRTESREKGFSRERLELLPSVFMRRAELPFHHRAGTFSLSH